MVTENLLSVTAIKRKYHLTAKVMSVLERSLSDPVIKTNPYYRSGPPMKLYQGEEVERLLETVEVQRAISEAKQRQARSAKAVATKREATRAIVDKAIAQFTVRHCKMKTVRREALDSKQAYYMATEQYENNAYEADKATQERFCVNYIRHELSNYDFLLERLENQVGASQEYLRFQQAVCNRIAETYPSLREECERQKRKKLDDYNRSKESTSY